MFEIKQLVFPPFFQKGGGCEAVGGFSRMPDIAINISVAEAGLKTSLYKKNSLQLTAKRISEKQENICNFVQQTQLKCLKYNKMHFCIVTPPKIRRGTRGGQKKSSIAISLAMTVLHLESHALHLLSYQKIFDMTKK